MRTLSPAPTPSHTVFCLGYEPEAPDNTPLDHPVTLTMTLELAHAISATVRAISRLGPDATAFLSPDPTTFSIWPVMRRLAGDISRDLPRSPNPL